MEAVAYNPGVAEERKHRNVRLPVEQMQAIQRLAEWRHRAGVDDQPNWTAALAFVIRHFEVCGGFENPQQAMAKVMEAAGTEKPKKK